MIWPDNPLNKSPLLLRISQKSEPQVNQLNQLNLLKISRKFVKKIKLQKYSSLH